MCVGRAQYLTDEQYDLEITLGKSQIIVMGYGAILFLFKGKEWFDLLANNHCGSIFQACRFVSFYTWRWKGLLSSGIDWQPHVMNSQFEYMFQWVTVILLCWMTQLTIILLTDLYNDADNTCHCLMCYAATFLSDRFYKWKRGWDSEARNRLLQYEITRGVKYHEVMTGAEQCLICWELYEKSSDVVQLACHQDHIFHPECLIKMVLQMNKTTCPICKQPI